MNFKEELNEEQIKAVMHTEGPALVLAGAGSGKTRVITYRIAYLLRILGVKPHQILAVTFTNKAADEMKERLGNLVGVLIRGIWIGTFHSVCARLLREFSDYLPYSKNFVIYDSEDERNLISEVMKELRIQEKNLPLSYTHRMISNLKNKLILPDEFTPYDYKTELLKEVYKKYEERLKENDAMDFDDLLFNLYNLLEKNENVREKLNGRFIHKLVDEYQDTNTAQYEILKRLSLKYDNVFVVGDDDQSIYGFRGADINNILNFEEDFPNSKVYKLEKNYRSTKRILEVASSVVKNNRFRKEKKLWTEAPEGEKITLFSGTTEKEEAEKLIKFLKKEMENYSKKEILITYRTNAQSRAIEEALLRENIAYKIVGSVKFYERKEIKDIISYIKFIVNKNDSISFSRILNTPKRGIGKATKERIEKISKEKNISLWEASEELAEEEKRVKDFVNLIRELEKIKRIDELINSIIEKTGYIEILKKEDTEESEGRIENIQELVSAVYEFIERSGKTSPEDYLIDVGLKTEIDYWDEKAEAVNLMTLHNTKGLEFEVVFIVGIGEGLLPHYRSIKEGNIEEERRLFYVGMTRAKKKLYLSYFNNPGAGWEGRKMILPSSFLWELPYKEVIDLTTERIGERRKNFDETSIWVEHPIFGRGKVLEVLDGDKLLISFGGETKKIKRSFLK
ncbi:MAG: UvrD-helicase domain-containing protein [candidate division WOR-3 bacterium]